jgi:hypothetical protein
VSQIVLLDELKQWLAGDAIADRDDDRGLQITLDAASAWVERRCGRTFSLHQAEDQDFYPNAEGLLDVVDLVAATGITVDSRGDRSFATSLESTDYELLPTRDSRGRPSVRYQQVRIWPTSSRSFGQGQLVRVTGDFGYVVDDAAPVEIKQAVLILASRFWKRHEAPLGVLQSVSLGIFERISKEDPDVMTLLAPFDRTTAWVAV